MSGHREVSFGDGMARARRSRQVVAVVLWDWDIIEHYRDVPATAVTGYLPPSPPTSVPGHWQSRPRKLPSLTLSASRLRLWFRDVGLVLFGLM